MTKEQKRELFFIQGYQAWPLWPYLPIKKRSKNPGEWPTFATLICESLESGPKPIVYKESIDQMIVMQKENKQANFSVLKEYKSLEEIVEDGWIVD